MSGAEMQAAIEAEREREHARWAGLPDVAIEAHLRGLSSDGLSDHVLIWALRDRAAIKGLTLEIIYR